VFEIAVSPPNLQYLSPMPTWHRLQANRCKSLEHF